VWCVCGVCRFADRYIIGDDELVDFVACLQQVLIDDEGPSGIEKDSCTKT
jgi:hypothetical protein